MLASRLLYVFALCSLHRVNRVLLTNLLSCVIYLYKTTFQILGVNVSIKVH